MELLDDLQELSQIDSGLMQPAWETLPLREVVHDLGASLDNKLPGLQITITGSESDLTRDIVTDSVRLRQTLINVAAAVSKKENPAPCNFQTAVIGPEGAQNLEFVFHCDGKLFSGAVLMHLFSAELPAQSFSRPYRAAGAGLVLAKRLCDLPGGALVINSSEEAGTTVRVEIPLLPQNKNFADSSVKSEWVPEK